MTDGLDVQRNLAAALKKLQTLQLQKAFDPDKPESRPTPQQQAVFDDIGAYQHRYVIGGNRSGKTATGGREVSWVFLDNHPTWTRPEEWGDMPLTMLIVGRTSTIVEQELWGKKIKPFLPAGTFKEHRNGGQLYKVTNPQNGNTMLFFSHHSPEEAREKLQAFTAQYVWLDEMVNSIKLLEELHRRVQSDRGYFLATFTPKIRNREIQSMIEADSCVHKRYKLNMLDNPVFLGREEEILESVKGLPENYRNAILYGSWYSGDDAVYDMPPQAIQTPENYSRGWRHLLAVDPASSGKTGLVLLAEVPGTTRWVIVLAKYLQEKVPSNLIALVEKEIASYNIVRRVADPHESWFIHEAWSKKIKYGTVYRKNDRKKELIKNLQERLYEGRLAIAPWCDDLIDEFTSCQWHETIDGKIVGASRFHLLDAAQYGVDSLPKPTTEETPISPTHALQIAHRERKRKEEAKVKTGRFRNRGRLYKVRGRKVKV